MAGRFSLRLSPVDLPCKQEQVHIGKDVEQAKEEAEVLSKEAIDNGKDFDSLELPVRGREVLIMEGRKLDEDKCTQAPQDKEHEKKREESATMNSTTIPNTEYIPIQLVNPILARHKSSSHPQGASSSVSCDSECRTDKIESLPRKMLPEETLVTKHIKDGVKPPANLKGIPTTQRCTNFESEEKVDPTYFALKI